MEEQSPMDEATTQVARALLGAEPERLATLGPWTAQDAALIFWDAGVKKRLAEQSDDPYIEDIDLRIDSGSRNSGSEYAIKAVTSAWHEVSDEIEESNWSYVAESRESSMRSEIDALTTGRGPLAATRDALSERMSLLDDDFDEDRFFEEVYDECFELAREDGVDHVFDIQARLRGGCEALLSQSFDFPRGPEDEQAPMVPNFANPDAASHWAQGLSFLNIHPADLANAARTRALSDIASPEYFEQIGAQTGTERAQIKRETRAELARQGLARRVSRDPSTWRGGMAELAKAWSAPGWSLPRDGSASAISVGDLVDSLCAEEGSIEAVFRFGVDGDDLQQHSALIDRFGQDAPLCGSSLAETSVAICSAELTLNDREVAMAGSVTAQSSSLSFEDSSHSGSDFQSSMASQRDLAAQASELSWLLRDHPEQGRRAQRIKDISRELGSQAPEAFEWAIERSNTLGASAASPEGAASSLADAREAFSLGAQAARERLAKLGKTPAAKPPTRIDDIELRHDGLANAPWRVDIKPALAFKLDSLGNSLAHKACACLDPLLLSQALKDNPALATQANMGGKTPMDLIQHAHANQAFLPLALSLISARPDLANERSKSGRALLDLAAARGLAPSDIGKLMEAGCSMQALDSHGRAPWFHWIHKQQPILNELLSVAIDRGWDINHQDSAGRSMAHLVTSLASARVLVGLGADLGLLDAEGRPGGCSIPARDFATLESEFLFASQPSAPSRGRPKSL
jgi:hypothetical protein